MTAPIACYVEQLRIVDAAESGKAAFGNTKKIRASVTRRLSFFREIMLFKCRWMRKCDPPRKVSKILLRPRTGNYVERKVLSTNK